MLKAILLKNSASTEKKPEQTKSDGEIQKICGSIANIRSEVGKLDERVTAMESIIHCGRQISKKEIVVD